MWKSLLLRKPIIPFVNFCNHLVTRRNCRFKSEDNGIHHKTESLLKTQFERQLRHKLKQY